MRIRRWHRAALVATLLTLPLTACGRDDSDGGADAGSGGAVSAGPATGEITVWAMGTEGEKLGELARDFMAENPKAKVNVTAVPWDAAHQKIANAIAGGQTPDVSLVGTTWMGEFTKAGAFNRVPDGLVDKSAFFDGAWNTGTVDGRQYGVPWYVETRLVYYRRDLAAKAGVTAAPKTWDELKAMAKALKERAGATYGLHLQPGRTGSWQTFLPFAWQNGAEVLDGDKFTLDTPEMVEALRYYQSYFSEGLADRNMDPGMIEQEFVAGRVGAFVSGPWHIGILREKGGRGFDQKFGVAHMPTGKSGGTSFVGGGNVAVFKDAKNRDAAWKFVSWLAKPETQVKWYSISADLPAVKAAWQDPKLVADPLLKAFGEQLDDAKSPPAFPRWEQVAQSLDGELERLCVSGADPAEVARAMQQKATAINTGA